MILGLRSFNRNWLLADCVPWINVGGTREGAEDREATDVSVMWGQQVQISSFVTDNSIDFDSLILHGIKT